MRSKRRRSWWVLRIGFAMMLLCAGLYVIECFVGIGWATKGGYFAATAEGWFGGGRSSKFKDEPGVLFKSSHIRGMLVYAEYGGGDAVLAIPLWMPWALCLPITAWAWRRERRAKNAIQEGLCVQCGYDRRGIEAKLPCPECGGRVEIPDETLKTG